MNIEKKEILNGIFTFIIFIVAIVLICFIWDEIQAGTKEKTEPIADKNISQSVQENEDDSLDDNLESAVDENEEVEDIEINEEPEKQLVIFECDKLNNLILVDKYIER